MEGFMIRRAAVLVSFCAVLSFGFTTAAPATAQVGTGEVHGTVTDPSGALIASATIVLNSPQGPVKSTTTGRDGAYRITAIAAGTYQLAISANGFAPLTIENIVVLSGRPQMQNVTLEIPVAQQQ